MPNYSNSKLTQYENCRFAYNLHCNEGYDSPYETIEAYMGSVEASTYSCSPGTTVKLTATPSDGWKFVKWESQQVTVNDGSFVMPDEDVNVKAVFEKASGSSSGFDWWWIPIIVAVIACIAGGFWFYNSRKA